MLSLILVSFALLLSPDPFIAIIEKKKKGSHKRMLNSARRIPLPVVWSHRCHAAFTTDLVKTWSQPRTFRASESRIGFSLPTTWRTSTINFSRPRNMEMSGGAIIKTEGYLRNFNKRWNQRWFAVFWISISRIFSVSRDESLAQWSVIKICLP